MPRQKARGAFNLKQIQELLICIRSVMQTEMRFPGEGPAANITLESCLLWM